MSETNALLIPGDKVHVIARRLFREDLRRHFAGEVINLVDGLCEVRGYAFVFVSGTNEYQRRPTVRTRIISLVDAINTINKLPADTDIPSLEYRMVNDRLVIIDKNGFSLDINEFGAIA